MMTPLFPGQCLSAKSASSFRPSDGSRHVTSQHVRFGMNSAMACFAEGTRRWIRTSALSSVPKKPSSSIRALTAIMPTSCAAGPTIWVPGHGDVVDQEFVAQQKAALAAVARSLAEFKSDEGAIPLVRILPQSCSKSWRGIRLNSGLAGPVTLLVDPVSNQGIQRVILQVGRHVRTHEKHNQHSPLARCQ